MNGDAIMITLVVAVSMLVVLIAKTASFLQAFAKETRYICYEMEHADSYKEYRRWRGELRCHYLCLIPFVNEKNVMRLYKRVYRRGDHAQKKERKDSLVPLLLPSVLGISICVVCVCSMTWAWFSASVQTPAQKMTAACYEVTVDSVKLGSDEINAQNGGYDLTAGHPYMVTLTASGSVKECGGYCLIQNTADGSKTYTQTIMPGNSITVAFAPTASGTYTFTGVWGSLPAGTENYLVHTEPGAEPVINDPTPDNTDAPAPTEPTAQPTDPVVTDPVQTDPIPEEPVSSEPEPSVTEPPVTEPPVTEPSDPQPDPTNSESESTEIH